MSLVKKIQSFVNYANNPLVNDSTSLEIATVPYNYFIASDVYKNQVRVPLAFSHFIYRGFSNSNVVAVPVIQNPTYRSMQTSSLNLFAIKQFFSFDTNFSYNSYARIRLLQDSPYRYYCYQGMILRQEVYSQAVDIVLLVYRIIEDTENLTSHLGLYINKDLLEEVEDQEFTELLNKKIINKILNLNKKGSINLREIITTPSLLGTEVVEMSLENLNMSSPNSVRNCDFNFRDRLKEIYKPNE